MKNKIIAVCCFVLGFSGFLWLFKITILDNTAPSDELAPGMVLLMALFSGTAATYVGLLLFKKIFPNN